MKECEHNDESISRGNKVSEGSFAFVILRLAGEILKLMASPFRQHHCNKASSNKQGQRSFWLIAYDMYAASIL